jgi:hypothetical protein
VTPANRATPRTGRSARLEGAGGDRWRRGIGVRRSGLHRPERRRSRPSARPQARSRQAPHGKKKIRAAATALGCRTELRLGRSFPQTRQRLGTSRHYPERPTPARLRHTHAQKSRKYNQPKFLTGSREVEVNWEHIDWCHSSRLVEQLALLI